MVALLELVSLLALVHSAVSRAVTLLAVGCLLTATGSHHVLANLVVLPQVLIHHSERLLLVATGRQRRLRTWLHAVFRHEVLLLDRVLQRHWKALRSHFVALRLHLLVHFLVVGYIPLLPLGSVVERCHRIMQIFCRVVKRLFLTLVSATLRCILSHRLLHLRQVELGRLVALAD